MDKDTKIKAKHRKLRQRSVTPPLPGGDIAKDLLWTDIEVLMKRVERMVRFGQAENLLTQRRLILDKGTDGRLPDSTTFVCRTKVGRRLRIGEVIVLAPKRWDYAK